MCHIFSCLQFFYMKHCYFNISYDGDWTADSFDVFIIKISSVTGSDYQLETLSKFTQRTVMASRRIGSSTGTKQSIKHSYYLVIALLLSGDISLNPGPVRFPCITCSKPVKSNQLAFQCDFCDRWIHRKCTNPLVTEAEFRQLERFTDNFYCQECKDRLPHLSDSFFDNSNLSDETFSTNTTTNDASLYTSYLSCTEISTNEPHDQSDIGQSHDSINIQDGDSHDAFEELRSVRLKNRDNVLITYLNVNSFRYKFMELGEILYDKLSDVCFFAETKQFQRAGL